MGGSLYDENGNDLLALESDMNHDAANQNGMSASYANNALSNTDASINDNWLLRRTN